jgi:regulatory protein
MIITAITPQKRVRTRCNIFLDGVYAFALPLELVVKNHLKVDISLTTEQVNKLVREGDFAHWYNQALLLISGRPRSEKELRNYFQRKKVGSETAKEVLKILADKNLINDSDYAKWHVEQRIVFRPKSRRLLRQELMQKGIASDTAETLINQLISPENEIEIAYALVQKKYQQWQQLDVETKRRKIAGFLGRRGFGWEVINVVLKRLSEIETAL